MTRSWVVTLSDAQVEFGLGLARRRRAQNRQAGHRHRWNADQDADFDPVGTLAELAVAHVCGVDWPPPDELQPADGDVGGIEVRATERMNGRLILHPDDKKHRPYVLVLAASPTFVLAGFYVPADGLKPEWWAEYRPGGGAYYVPMRDLRPMRDLPLPVRHG